MKSSTGVRILMLLENNPFPQDARVRREAAALTADGHQVTVVCPSGKGQPSTEVVDGVRVYRYPGPAGGDGLAGYVWEFGYSLAAAFFLSLRAWASPGFDVVHAHNPPDILVLIGGFFKLFGKSFVFDHHDLSPEMYYARFAGKGRSSVYRALMFFENLTFRLADHVIATNESYKTIAVERGRVPENRVTVVRNGPELNRVRLTAPDPTLRAKAPHIFGYVGQMGPQDGVDYFIRALARLVRDLNRTDFYAVIIGGGDSVKGLQELTSDLGLADRVWFPGRVSDEDLLKYLSTADICVDPDPSNPFNDRSTMIKMTEYMALGKPIVAFDLPEHRVTAGEAAAYAKGNDELDFARRLLELMDDPERRAQMGRTGMARVHTSLAWSHQTPALLEVYREFARRHGRN